MKPTILLTEDDAFLRDGLYELLTREGYAVTAAANSKAAKSFMAQSDFDLYILDVLLPDGNGVQLCRSLRDGGVEKPILFLTACDDENEIILGLDSGADDYVTKPFAVKILLSRIRALLRRHPADIYESDGLYIDMRKMTVRKNGETVLLTPTEYQLLTELVKNAGIVLTRSALLSKIWDCDGNFIDGNTLSVHISRLREKIGSDKLVTVRGVGYRWEG